MVALAGQGHPWPVAGRLDACLRQGDHGRESEWVLRGGFESQQGVKQGCPLSTKLFGIFIESLADLIDANDSTFRPHRVHLRCVRPRDAYRSFGCRKQLTASGSNAMFGLMGKLHKQRLWAPTYGCVVLIVRVG